MAEEEKVNTYGLGNVEDKQKAIDKEYDDAFTIDDIIDYGSSAAQFITKDIPESTVWAYKKLKEVMTPGFIRRRQIMRVHSNQIKKEEK
jgi:hypothetical protein